MRTNHPVTVLTDIYFTWLSLKCVDANAKYYMCAYAQKCFTFTLRSFSCPLVVWTFDAHLRMTCMCINQERKKLTSLNLCSSCESSIHGVHKKCVTSFHWKLEGKTDYSESLHWRIILKWILWEMSWRSEWARNRLLWLLWWNLVLWKEEICWTFVQKRLTVN